MAKIAKFEKKDKDGILLTLKYLDPDGSVLGRMPELPAGRSPAQPPPRPRRPSTGPPWSPRCPCRPGGPGRGGRPTADPPWPPS